MSEKIKTITRSICSYVFSGASSGNIYRSVNLLSPTSENLRTYVNSYVTQLQLERFESASLEAQLFEDYQNQFTVGTELLRWVREVVLIKPGVLAKIFDRKGIEAAAARQIEVGDDIHKRLITAVIAPSDTIRRVIDVHVVRINEIQDFKKLYFLTFISFTIDL